MLRIKPGLVVCKVRASTPCTITLAPHMCDSMPGHFCMSLHVCACPYMCVCLYVHVYMWDTDIQRKTHIHIHIGIHTNTCIQEYNHVCMHHTHILACTQ